MMLLRRGTRGDDEDDEDDVSESARDRLRSDELNRDPPVERCEVGGEVDKRRPLSEEMVLRIKP